MTFTELINRYPIYRQINQADCGPACLKMIFQFYGKYVPIDHLRELTEVDREGVSIEGLSLAAAKFGLDARGVMTDFETIKKKLNCPYIAHWKENHFIVTYKISKKAVLVGDPAIGLIKYTFEEFKKGWCGENNSEKGILLLLEPNSSFNQNAMPKPGKYSFKQFFKPFYLRYKRYWVRLLSTVFIIAALQFSFPFLTQTLVDQGLRNEDVSLIYIILIAQLVLFLSQSVAEVLRSWLLLHLGNRISNSIASDFISKLLKLPISFFDKKTTGDLFQRIDDVDRIERFVTSNSLTIILSLLSFSVYLAILLLYHIAIFWIFLSGSMVFVFWIILFQKKRKAMDNQRFQIMSQDTIFTHQLIYGIQEIKLNLSERRRKLQWQNNRIQYFNLTEKILSINQYQNVGGRVINELKNILITFLAVKLVIEGHITIGMLLAIQFIIGQLNSPLLALIDFIQSGQDAKLSSQRLKEFIDQKDEKIKTTPIPVNADITIKDVSFRYLKNTNYTLRHLSFIIPHNKVTAIVGMSGMGKTTLLKLLLNFYKPSSGSIFLGNIPLEFINSREWLSKCGVVMQNGFIFNDSLLKNITESNSDQPVNNEKLWEVINLINLSGLISSLPKGLNTKIGKNGVPLSGGQVQRVLIARALYKDPTFLFFDEATSNLDAENEKIITTNMEKYYQNKTVVIIAHRLSTVQHANQIIVLDKGTVVEIGNHMDLVNKRGKYFALIKNQLALNDHEYALK